METLRKITEDEMIALFLKGELSSSRFKSEINDAAEKLKIDTKILSRPNLQSNNENHQRRELLGEFRGYGRNKELFENFPQKLDWEIVKMNKTELSKVLYISYSYWLELSNNSRLPSKAAENIRKGKIVYDTPNDGFIKAAEFLRGGGSFPMMIFVTNSSRNKIVVLEGHLRLTAYNLSQECIPKSIEAVLGVSDEIEKWDMF
ncbi:hypothetical protein JW710_02380 [Candidatus Dojkabacteria bacterium]|nr:hypothetical protein [Candidatus Dojkabacteria bacterium]